MPRISKDQLGKFAADFKPIHERPTGQEIFDSLSPEKQDEMLGPAAADLVRNGEATLADFVAHEGGFITQKPVESVKAWREEDHPRDERGRFGDKPKVPKWERQRRYNGWVRKLSTEEQEVLAMQFYRKLWKELRGYFDAIGEPPPELVFVDTVAPGSQAQLFMDERGIRQIQMRPSAALKLALKGRKEGAINTIAHEWRHVYQNADLFWIGADRPISQRPIERDAEAFAAEAVRGMRRNRRRRKRGLPLIRPKPYNPQNISENIGKDPTTIPL